MSKDLDKLAQSLGVLPRTIRDAISSGIIPGNIIVENGRIAVNVKELDVKEWAKRREESIKKG